jgi:hypothetical protein
MPVVQPPSQSSASSTQTREAGVAPRNVTSKQHSRVLVIDCNASSRILTTLKSEFPPYVEYKTMAEVQEPAAVQPYDKIYFLHYASTDRLENFPWTWFTNFTSQGWQGEIAIIFTRAAVSNIDPGIEYKTFANTRLPVYKIYFDYKDASVVLTVKNTRVLHELAEDMK